MPTEQSKDAGPHVHALNHFGSSVVHTLIVDDDDLDANFGRSYETIEQVIDAQPDVWLFYVSDEYSSLGISSTFNWFPASFPKPPFVVADINGSEAFEKEHLAEAIS